MSVQESRQPTFSLQTRWPSFYLVWSMQTLFMDVHQIIKLINKNIQFHVYIIIYYSIISLYYYLLLIVLCVCIYIYIYIINNYTIK